MSISDGPWNPDIFRGLLRSEHQLSALDYLLRCWREETMRPEQAIREMLSARRLVEVAVLIARDAVAKDSRLAHQALYEVVLSASSELVVVANSPRKRSEDPRTGELVRKVASGGELTPSERMELIGLLGH